MDVDRIVEVSAPSKVMICGSYVVLYNYISSVLTTTARMHVTVRTQPAELYVPEAHVIVESPQFGSTFQYKLNPPGTSDDPRLLKYVIHVNCANVLTPLRQVSGSGNKYISDSIEYALMAMQDLAENMKRLVAMLDTAQRVLHIVIRGDNDFYSQRAQLQELNLPLSEEGLKQLQPWTHVGSQVRKTGLGSSAALVTALTAALCVWLDVCHVTADQSALSETDLRHIHSLAQIAHCTAQGKIGSGFDVSSAVFGSQVYQQFQKQQVQQFMDLPFTAQQTQLRPLITSWTTTTHRAMQLPPGLRLVLADVYCGADTPSMVKQVLAWASAHPTDSKTLFDTLNSYNQRIVLLFDLLNRLAQNSPHYWSDLHRCATLKQQQWHAEWPESQQLLDGALPDIDPRPAAVLTALATVFNSLRASLRHMSEVTGVGIEPPAQTRLLDAAINTVTGIVLAGVPGAGGLDAQFALVIDVPALQQHGIAWQGQEPKSQLHSLWQTWTEM